MDVWKKLHNFQLRLLETDRVTPRVPFEKLIVPQLVEKFAPFYKTNNPLLVPVMSQINQVRAPNPMSLISILISHVCLGLPSGLFPSGFPITHLYRVPLLPSYMLHAAPISSSSISMSYYSVQVKPEPVHRIYKPFHLLNDSTYLSTTEETLPDRLKYLEVKPLH